jgi:transcriptional regulator with XRE-family HTH domain
MSNPVPPRPLPKHEAKAAFAKRLYTLMTARGWRQSDLARHASLPRDAISSYVRAKVFPTPSSVEALCRAFGMSRAELIPFEIDPTLVGGQFREIEPFGMKFSLVQINDGGPPINLLVNQRVTLSQLGAVATALGYDLEGNAGASDLPLKS